MGFIDTLRRLVPGSGKRGGRRKQRAPRKPPGGHDALPGGASAREAAEASPARAKELAD
jgi:hypothetical protein